MRIIDPSPYLGVMRDIKHRVLVVQAFLDGTASAIYVPTQVESMVLQIRMIMELIALGSLAANKEVFEAHSVKFTRHWEPSKILRDVGQLNPRFYPRPFRTAPMGLDGVIDHIPVEGFLTKDELVQIHGRCGDLLHAKNPFGKGADYAWFRSMVPLWLEKVVKLLNNHEIYLLGDETMYVIQMSVEGSDDVHMTTLELVRRERP